MVAAALAIGVTIPQTSFAQQRACGARDPIIERLHTKYGETRQSMGLNHNNGIVEVYASSETGTWTIILTMPTGQSCLIAAGENWDMQPEPSLTKGKGA